jgi:dienelactone hydrolase
MNLHRLLDVYGQKRMWRYPDAPVESTVEDIERFADLADAALQSGSLRSTSRSPASDELHPAVEAPEFELRQNTRREGVLEEHFTFPSQCPSGDAAVDTVQIMGWRPRSRGRQDTALVMAHGAFARDHDRVRWFVPSVASSPWDTFSIELPHHMRRQRADSVRDGQFFVSADVPRLVRAMHQSETDIRALVRGLRKMGYRRIVLGGISLSGNIVFQAVLRERVDGAFAVVPSMDAYASLWESVLGESIRPVGNVAGFTDETVRRALRLVTPRHMGRPIVPGERLLLIYGANDLLCPAAPIRALRDAWGIPNERVLETGHATLVIRFWTVRRIVAEWMRAVTGRP